MSADEKVPLLEKETEPKNCCDKKVPISYLVITAVVLCICIVVACLGVYFGYKNNHPPASNGHYVTEIDAASRSQLHYRLPTALAPVEYRLSLQPYLVSKAVFDPAKTHLFDGNATILIECREPAGNLTLHGDNITIHDYWLTDNGLNAKSDLIRDSTSHTYNTVTYQYVFPFTKKCTKGVFYNFHVRYTGYLADDLAGFYKTKYTDQNEQRWLAVSHFESTGARRVAPMFDEPSFKAVWHLTLTHPAEMVALGNMEVSSTEELPDGWKRTKFNPSLKMSSYLLAFFVGDFVYTESTVANTVQKTRFRVYSRHDFADQTSWASYCGPKVLSFFEKYFDVEFPLPKVDLLPLPEFDAGAMENWGLITYREEALLYDRRLYPPSTKQSVASITAHELGHQWFGDLVTMDWWSDIWLNEGFAAFLQYRGTAEISDYKWDMEDRYVVVDMQTAMTYDELPTSHPIYKPSETPAEISLLFDKISYDKGNAILTMLNHTLGHDVFVGGLHYYLTKHAYSNANHQDLFDAWQIAVDKAGTKGWDGRTLDITEFMNRWIIQMGFPMVNVKRQGDSIKITQKRFLLESETEGAPSPYNYQWYTPLWYLNRTCNQDEMTWLKKDETLTLKGPAFPSNTWYLMNPNAYGFYRVNYDAANWRQLHTQLLKDPSLISVSARAQLLDDAFTLAIAGTLPYGYALNLTCYLGSEKNYVPWAAAYSNLNYIGRMLSLSIDYGKYKTYMLTLLDKIYPHVAIFDDSVSDDEVMWYDLQTSTLKQACKLDHMPCRQFALKAFAEYKKNCSSKMSSDPTCNHLSPNVRQTVYCTAVSELGASAYDFLFGKQSKETLNKEAVNIVRALTCAKQPWLLVKLLRSSVNGELVRNQIRYLYGYIPNNPIAVGVVWNWMAENWDYIMEKIGGAGYGAGDLGRLLTAATSNFNKEYQYTMVKDFLDAHEDMGRVKETFENALSKIRTNINWMKQHEEDVIVWLRTQSRCL